MIKSQTQRIGIALTLALVMAATRIHHSLIHHFDALPDASWGIFFLAGFWLHGGGPQTNRYWASRYWAGRYWAFALLMVEAVLIDYLVITRQGLDFWSHYCLSAAYWFLIPAYFSLWAGGSWLAKHQHGLRASTLLLACGAVLIGTGACYLISNGSFYWLSNSVPLPRSFSAWFKNLGDWCLPFFETTLLYVSLGAVLHVLAVTMTRWLRQDSKAGSH